MFHRVSSIGASATLVWATLWACATPSEPPGTGGFPTTGDGGGGAPSSMVTVTTTGFTTSSTGGSGGEPDVGGGCASSSSQAEPVPLDIFVMLDQSGSMNEDAGNAMTKWQSVKAALSAFVQQDGLEGIGIGIQYFGLPTPSVAGCTQQTCSSSGDCTGGCTTCSSGVCHAPFNPDDDSCEAIEYAWAEVPIQPLPGVANAIISSLAVHFPGTNTPTLPALQGAVDHAKAWQLAHPDRITIVAFATDGDPAICGTDLDVINAVAAAAYNGTPSIKTFVIGVGGSLTALDGIAAAGGTTEAFNVDYDPMATALFLEALNTIRRVALPCVYQIPSPPRGMDENFDLVNVEYTPSDGGPTQTFPRVADEAACPADEDGWYYDDPSAPTQIILCPATCDKVAQDLTAQVDIAIGCQTVVP